MYTCPMHPEIISDKLGKCPKCGMDLVKKDAPLKVHKTEDKGLGVLTWESYKACKRRRIPMCIPGNIS